MPEKRASAPFNAISHFQALLVNLTAKRASARLLLAQAGRCTSPGRETTNIQPYDPYEQSAWGEHSELRQGVEP